MLSDTSSSSAAASGIVQDVGFPTDHRHVLKSTPSVRRPSLWRTLIGKKNERETSGPRLFAFNTEEQYAEAEQAAEIGTAPSLRGPEEKYGKRWMIIGDGGFGTVSLYRVEPKNGRAEMLFAVKEFHRRPGQPYAKYVSHVLTEFRLSRNMRHANVIGVLDLLQDEARTLFEVMQFCAGGTLFAHVESSGALDAAEADCFFIQLMRGVNYLHEYGVAHCDLKPENLLLTAEGNLKISDFSCSQQFRVGPGGEVRFLSGLRGSKPYVAPEEYKAAAFDGRAVDVWACGITYMLMRLARFLWHAAEEDDELYAAYLKNRREEWGYAPLEAMEPEASRNIVYCMLDPLPQRRLTAAQFLKSGWARSIRVCKAGCGS